MVSNGRTEIPIPWVNPLPTRGQCSSTYLFPFQPWGLSLGPSALSGHRVLQNTEFSRDIEPVGNGETEIDKEVEYTHTYTDIYTCAYIYMHVCMYMKVKWKWKLLSHVSLWPNVLYSSLNSLGQNTGVGSLSLLQGIFPTQGWKPGFPDCGQILYQLSHKGSLCMYIYINIYI